MRLYVGNVSEATETDDLYDLFSAYGSVVSVCIKPGFAFIEFAEGADLAKAKAELHNTELKGNKLAVKDSNESGPRTPYTADTVSVHLIAVPSSATWQQVQTLVSEVGTVTRAETYGLDQQKKLQRVVVAFDSVESAENCVRKFDGYQMDTQAIRAYLGIQHKASAKGPKSPAKRNAPAGFMPPETVEELPLRLLLPNRVVGAVIGKGGSAIKEITQKTGAKIDVQRREPYPSSPDRLVTVMGSAEAVNETYKEIARRIDEDAAAQAAEGKEGEDGKPAEPTVPLRVLIANDMVGHLIGKAGATIKQIMASTNAHITINTNDDGLLPINCRIVSASGTLDERAAAQNTILTKLRSIVKTHASSFSAASPLASGYGAAFPVGLSPVPAGARGGYGVGVFGAPIVPPAPEKTVVYCASKLVGAVIGRSGANIKDIMAQSGAHVRVLKDDEESEDENSESRIVITGTVDAQFKAQQLIYLKFVEQAAQSVPLPGMSTDVVMKVSVPIPFACVGRVIGKKGARIKQISQVSGARIEVSKPESATENATVTISGVFSPCQVAQSLIRNVIGEQGVVRDAAPAAADKAASQ